MLQSEWILGIIAVLIVIVIVVIYYEFVYNKSASSSVVAVSTTPTSTTVVTTTGSTTTPPPAQEHPPSFLPSVTPPPSVAPPPPPSVPGNELANLCQTIPTCESISQVDMNDWTVNCNGWAAPNTLHKNSETNWNWNNGYNTATFATYTSASDAVTAACPSFTDPLSVCLKVPGGMCTEVTQQGPQDWNVSCTGQPDNVLHMNSPTEWIWNSEFNAATQAKYTDPLSAMTAACPVFAEADTSCTLSNNCYSTETVTIPGYGVNQYAVQCVGDPTYTNTIIGAPGSWGFYKGYDSTTFAKYPDVPSAITAYCKDSIRGGEYDH